MRHTDASVCDLIAHGGSQYPCTFLIGAGCSVKGGIPAASGIVELVKTKMPELFCRVASQAYEELMAAIPEGQRWHMFSGLVRSASPTLFHTGVAQLVKKKFVAALLTTNFDDLIERALMSGKIPVATHNLTLPRDYWVPPPTDSSFVVSHLHGVHTGKILINTAREVIEHWEEHRRTMGHVFKDAGESGPWVVVGYGGSNPYDPVMNLLRQVKIFEHGLYWMHRGEVPYGPRSQLERTRNVHFVSIEDADELLCTWTKKLVGVDMKAAQNGELPPDDLLDYLSKNGIAHTGLTSKQCVMDAIECVSREIGQMKRIVEGSDKAPREVLAKLGLVCSRLLG